MDEAKRPEPTEATGAFLEEVLRGLSADPKWLSPKWLYDEVGSALFDRITQLEEYYPTRVETAILRREADALAEAVGSGSVLVEFGSGSSVKTRLLLDRARDLSAYVPIDISEEHLLKTAAMLREDYPSLRVVPLVADYTTPLTLPAGIEPSARRVAYFPGSTLGNFHPTQALKFLERVATLCGPGGGMLLGVDLKKDPRILHAAYNDRDGVTAAFNLNLLTRMNREIDADFDLARFVHYAFYNPEEGRVEMHVVSLCDQDVHVAGQRFHFGAGESLWTESSYKFSIDQMRALAAAAGFSVRRVWTDERRWFGVLDLELP